MTVCEIKTMKHRRLCAGDLDRKITIKSRALTPPDDGVDFDQVFEVQKNIWAGLQTTKGKVMFASTNMEKPVTHVFYIRSIYGLTAESWVVYKSENYDIIDIENLDERDEFMALYCNVRGDNAVEVNYA